jgi:N-acetylglucosaminyl-diphospho-decaprenol L-rhamnosyltransferase
VPKIDVVVVAYNSSEHLRACVEPLARLDNVRVIVADNASIDDSLGSVDDLPITTLALGRNGGFAHGCNAGWRAGEGEYAMFLNPDARISGEALRSLADVLDASPDVGAVAPLIRHDDGTLEYSQRRYPRLRSTYAQALFLHRLAPTAPWTDELVRDEEAYEHPTDPDWVTGAALMIRRSLLEEIGGFDEGFFMYCEDIDICKRVRERGYALRFEPSATMTHVGGASAPRSSLFPVLAASRIRYAEKHRSRPFALLERAGIALSALTHIVVAQGGRAARTGHARALRVAVSRTAESS